MIPEIKKYVFMKRPYRIILTISVVLTTILFLHEYLYDIPGTPYTILQTISEIIFTAPLFTGFFFLIISGTYLVINLALPGNSNRAA